MKKFVDKQNKFVELFNPQTGFYARSGIIDEHGKDTGVDPFMRSFPALIDVGIMEKCVCAHRCKVDCYQKAISRTGNNMSLEDYKEIMKQSKGKVFQCLEENELVLIKSGDFVQSKKLKDVKAGELVFCGDNNFAYITEKLEKKAEVYDIELEYGKHIIATAEHKFPIASGLKTVSELNIEDILLNTKQNFNIEHINSLDIVKMIISQNLGTEFYIF